VLLLLRESGLLAKYKGHTATSKKRQIDAGAKYGRDGWAGSQQQPPGYKHCWSKQVRPPSAVLVMGAVNQPRQPRHEVGPFEPSRFGLHVAGYACTR